MFLNLPLIYNPGLFFKKILVYVSICQIILQLSMRQKQLKKKNNLIQVTNEKQ